MHTQQERKHKKQPLFPIKRARQQPQKAAFPVTVLFESPEKKASPKASSAKLFWCLSFHIQWLLTDIFITKVWVKLVDLHSSFAAGGWRGRRGHEQAYLFLRSYVSLIRTSWSFELQNNLILKITLRLNTPSQVEIKLAHTNLYHLSLLSVSIII